jgi:hypothetical protein
MASYISSNANRFYAALESAYGRVGEITANNRIPAVRLAVRQQVEAAERRDKTGSRTFAGLPAGLRRKTTFDLRTYLSSWNKGSESGPGYGPLFQAALGGTPLAFAGGAAASGSSGTNLVLSAQHGLVPGQAVSFGGEIRFVSAVASPTAVVLNAPFVTQPGTGAAIGATVTLMPATELPSVSIFDYWSPTSAIQRILYGAAVDRLEIEINGDLHEAKFSGIAREIADSGTFESGMAQLEAFPPEPLVSGPEYSVVPGHMGQAWIGTSAERFCTITGGSIAVDNSLEARWKEFGGCEVRSISAGQRKVTASFELYSKDDEKTVGLYQAARQQSPISVMFQLGEVEGQLTGVYLKSVVPEVPEFDDSENRLKWRFRDSRAQGTVDDEIAVAFA